MHHVAVDLGSRKSQFCVRTPDGQILREGKVPNGELARVFQGLEVKSRVVLETCSEAFAVADLANAAGHEVNVVPATLAPSLGVGQRGVKTDKKGAQNLSLASCRMEQLPRVHVPSRTSRERRALLASRGVLVSSRTALINHVRGWARTQLLVIPSGKSKTFPERVREKLFAGPGGLPEHIERVLQVVEELSTQTAAADEELEALYRALVHVVRHRRAPGIDGRSPREFFKGKDAFSGERILDRGRPHALARRLQRDLAAGRHHFKPGAVVLITQTGRPEPRKVAVATVADAGILGAINSKISA